MIGNVNIVNALFWCSPTGLYARTQDLKKKNPSLKFLLAIGGWRVGSEPFTAMVGSEENRKSFIRNAIKYLRKHNFDGLDMDWEFPGTRGSSAEDKVLYTGLIRVSIREYKSCSTSVNTPNRHLKGSSRYVVKPEGAAMYVWCIFD